MRALLPVDAAAAAPHLVAWPPHPHRRCVIVPCVCVRRLPRRRAGRAPPFSRAAHAQGYTLLDWAVMFHCDKSARVIAAAGGRTGAAARVRAPLHPARALRHFCFRAQCGRARCGGTAVQLAWLAGAGDAGTPAARPGAGERGSEQGGSLPGAAEGRTAVVSWRRARVRACRRRA